MKTISNKKIRDKITPKVFSPMFTQMSFSTSEQIFLDTWYGIKLAIDKQIQDFLIIPIMVECRILIRL